MNFIEKFNEIYQREPEGVAFCPYRICPIGAHIDHQMGKITGFAIDKGISIAYRPKPKKSLALQASHMCFLIPTLIIAVKYGFKVLYISRALIRLQMIINTMLIMHVMYKIKVGDVLKNTLLILVSSVIMGVAAYLLRLVSDSLWWQIIEVLICIVVHFVELFYLFHAIKTEILESPES